MDKKKKFVNPRFARKGEYERVIKSIIKEGKCPFCPEYFIYHKEPILKREGGWLITPSSWPYKNSKYHFLIIGKFHKENILELNEKDFLDIKKLINWIVKKFKIKGGSLLLRFGNTEYTGATVAHLHFHFIVPKLIKGKSITVNFPIG